MRMTIAGHSGIFILDWQEKYINDHYIVGLDGCKLVEEHLRFRLDSAAAVIDKQGRVVIDLREELRLTKDVVRDLRAADGNSQKQIADLEKKGKFVKSERNLLILAGLIYAGIHLFK